MPSAIPKSAPPIRDQQRDIAEAVRDTVTVRGVTDYSPRTKMGRSQTQMFVFLFSFHTLSFTYPQYAGLLPLQQHATPRLLPVAHILRILSSLQPPP